MAENDSKKPQVNKSGERWVPQYSGFSKVGHFFSFDQPGTPIFNKTQSQNKTSESQLTKEQQALKKAYQQESIESAQKQFLFLTEGERNQLLDWSDPF